MRYSVGAFTFQGISYRVPVKSPQKCSSIYERRILLQSGFLQAHLRVQDEVVRIEGRHKVIHLGIVLGGRAASTNRVDAIQKPRNLD